MVISVHSPTKEALPRRTLFATLLLLGVVSLLAVQMSWQRAGNPLGPQVKPGDWAISFEPPRGWVAAPPAPAGNPIALPYHGVTRSGQPATMVFWRLERPPENDLPLICAMILDQHDVLVPPDLRAIGYGERPADLCDVDGLEQSGPRNQAVVRATVLSTGNAYAVSLSIDGATIDDHTYRIFDLAARSVRCE
ncbi:MAG: hypothetical protein JSU63_02125 [Phycisphaerales bacterium]|nr:MAG: hypothetical protein JSU63_02125 [Phycisphaerales bacterium]